jgi:hypothetical protein
LCAELTLKNRQNAEETATGTHIFVFLSSRKVPYQTYMTIVIENR